MIRNLPYGDVRLFGCSGGVPVWVSSGGHNSHDSWLTMQRCDSSSACRGVCIRKLPVNETPWFMTYHAGCEISSAVPGNSQFAYLPWNKTPMTRVKRIFNHHTVIWSSSSGSGGDVLRLLIRRGKRRVCIWELRPTPALIPFWYLLLTIGSIPERRKSIT